MNLSVVLDRLARLGASHEPTEAALDWLAVLSALCSSVLADVEREPERSPAVLLRAMVQPRESAKLAEDMRAAAARYGDALRAAAELQVPPNWPVRPSGDLCALGPSMGSSALAAVSSSARWWGGLPGGQPDDCELMEVAAEVAREIQGQRQVTRAWSGLIAEASEADRGTAGDAELVQAINRLRAETRGTMAGKVLIELMRDPTQSAKDLAAAVGCNRTALYSMQFGRMRLAELRALLPTMRPGRHDGIEAVDDRLPDGSEAKVPAKRRTRARRSE